MNGKEEPKCGALAWDTFYRNGAAVFLNNALHDGEPETRSLPGFFGRDKRMEDLGEQFGGNAMAGIGNAELNLPILFVVVGPYGEVTTIGHGMDGIKDQIHDDLHQVIMISLDLV